MNNNYYTQHEFMNMWKEVYRSFGKSLTGFMLNMAWSILKDYTRREIQYGLKQHFADPEKGMFCPLPANVTGHIVRLMEDDGRPGVEEAWSMMPQGESESIVWTVEMRDAYHKALPLLEDGDKIAARMVFKEVYEKALAKVRKHRVKPEWIVSLGHDQTHREDTLREAAQVGRLTNEKIRKYLPEPVSRKMLGHDGDAVESNVNAKSVLADIINMIDDDEGKKRKVASKRAEKSAKFFDNYLSRHTITGKSEENSGN